MTGFAAAIFDLDGVLADSARAHYAAWKRIADELCIAFDEAANEALKGVDRMGSLRMLLALGGRTLDEGEMAAIAARKNGYYLESVAAMTPEDLLPGAEALLREARAAGLRCAVASASRNAPLLLDRLGIASLFDFVADAGAISLPKPAPDIFLSCASTLGVAPGRCLAFEDSAAGVESINAAGMFAVGIGDPQVLGAARVVYPRTADVRLGELLRQAPVTSP